MAVEKQMLRRTIGGGQWPKTGLYDNRDEAARIFVQAYGANWRSYVQGNPRVNIQ